MRGGLRNRRDYHAGIPQGSTMGFGNKLMFAYLFNTGITLAEPTEVASEGSEEIEAVATLVKTWADSGPGGKNATQATAENMPRQANDKSIEFFHHSDNADSADYMSFSSFLVSASTPFMSFIVCDLDDTSTSCYLSQQGTEVLQYTSGSQHQLKTGVTSNMTHSGTFTISNSEKHLFVVERDASDNIFLYKNGLKHDPSTTNNGNFDFQYLGVKNNPGAQTNWFDGKMYDVIFIDGEQDSFKRKKIEDYLLKKHKLQRLGNG